MTDKANTFVGIDLGGAQTRCMVATSRGARLRYVSHGAMPLVRWHDGDFHDRQATRDAVFQAVLEAEQTGGLTVGSAVVGVGAGSVGSRLVHAVTRLPEGQLTVAESDVGNVLRLCSSAVPGAKWTAVQVVPQEFDLGGENRVRNPLGLTASRLDAFVRVVAMSRREHDRTKRLVNQASVSVEETVLGGFAAGYSTLSERECVGGVAHMDFGKVATSLTAYHSGVLRMASGIPVGRDQLVSDVARAFNTETAVASSLISDFGGVDQREERSSAFVMVPGVRTPQGANLGRAWPRRTLDRVIGHCLEECMELALEELRIEGLMRGGVRSLVVTGDIAALPGIKEMAQSVMGLRTRIGLPTEPEGLPVALQSPKWASAAGLVRYAHRLAGKSNSQSVLDIQEQEVLRDRADREKRGVGWSWFRGRAQLHA